MSDMDIDSTYGSTKDTSERDAILIQFQEVSGIENFDECRNYLESTDWNLENAINLFYASDHHHNDAPANHSAMGDVVAANVQFVANGPTPYESSIPEEGFSFNVLARPPIRIAQNSLAENSSSKTQKVPNKDNPFEALIEPEELMETKKKLRKMQVNSDDGSLSGGEDGSSFGDSQIRFVIDYKGRQIPLSLADSETIGNLTERCAKMFGNKSPSSVTLTGWPPMVRAAAAEPATELKSLKLPRKITIIMSCSTDTEVAAGGSGHLEEALSKKYHISIQDVTNGERHDVWMEGSKTLGELKQNVYSLTRIPPSRQLWTGLPPEADGDDTVLGHCNLDSPVHNCTVERLQTLSSPDREEGASASASRRRGSDSDEETSFMDSWDDPLANAGPTEFLDDEKKDDNTLPLIPEDFRSAQDALENFTRVFESRYGSPHPPFYVGSLIGALDECFSKELKERRPLAIYLHHDKSVASNIFCSQVLCSEQVVNVLSANYVVWPWDMTSVENKRKLVEWVGQYLGGISQDFVRMRGVNPESYPMLILVGKHRNSFELLGAAGSIRSAMSAEEVMMTLMQAQEEFAEMVQTELVDQREQQQREMFRQEQAMAFEESLEQDRKKAEEKKREEEEKRLEELKQKEEEDLKLAVQESLAARLPDEPSADCSQPVATLRFRLPTGDTVTRRFLASARLKTLLLYAASVGYPTEEFKIVTSFPKKDLTEESNLDASLEALNLCPREQLTIEQR